MNITTINKCHEEIEKNYKSAGLTSYGLRQLVLNGTISSIKRGNRYLIDMDEVLDYLDFRKLPTKEIIKKSLAEEKEEMTIKKAINRFIN